MRFLDRLNQYQIAKNTSVLALAQILSRAFAIFYVAALARHVGQYGIGQITSATALNAILLIIVGPGFTFLFVRDVASDKEKAAAYVSNMLFLRLLFIVPFVLLSILFAYSGRYAAETAPIIHLYTVVFVLDTLGEIMIATFRAYERMEYEAGLQIVRDAVNIVISLIGIALGWPLVAIVAVSVLAQAVKFIGTLFLLRRNFVRFRFRIDLKLSRYLLFASFPFGILLVIQTLQAELGTFVLSLYYDEETVGVYGPAATIMLMLMYVPQAFAAAIFPNYSRLHNGSKAALRRYYRLAYKYLVVLGFPLGLGTILVGDRAIMLIYGEEFSESATVIRIMGLFLFTIVGYTNGPLLQATGRQQFFAWSQGIAAIFNAVLSFTLVPPLGPEGAAIAFVATGLITFVWHSAACHRQLELSLPWLLMLRVLLATALMGLAVVAAIEVGIAWILAAVVVAPAVYLAALFGLRIMQMDELKTLAGAPMEEQAQPEPGIEPVG